jgi:L-amino acid N-acyltransferase YncA
MTERWSGDLPAVQVEPMTPADWESVVSIYREGIATGHATFGIEAPH